MSTSIDIREEAVHHGKKNSHRFFFSINGRLTPFTFHSHRFIPHRADGRGDAWNRRHEDKELFPCSSPL